MATAGRSSGNPPSVRCPARLHCVLRCSAALKLRMPTIAQQMLEAGRRVRGMAVAMIAPRWNKERQACDVCKLKLQNHSPRLKLS